MAPPFRIKCIFICENCKKVFWMDKSRTIQMGRNPSCSRDCFLVRTRKETITHWWKAKKSEAK